MSEYKTKQRELILDYLIKNKDKHKTADDLTDCLKSLGVGKATVYRYLEKLLEENIIRKFLTDDGPACYQYIDDKNCNIHYHFKCTDCGRLLHVDCKYLDEMPAHILEHHQFIPDTQKTIFYGHCVNCKKGEKDE